MDYCNVIIGVTFYLVNATSYIIKPEIFLLLRFYNTAEENLYFVLLLFRFETLVGREKSQRKLFPSLV